MKDVMLKFDKFPDFPKKGINFIDISSVLADPEQFRYIIKKYAELLGNEELFDGFDVIAGMDSRGFIFGSALAYVMKKPFVMIRKAGKLPGEVVSESYGLEYGKDTLEVQIDKVAGKRVVIVDDLLATGGTLQAACRAITRAGGKVVLAATVIELEDLSGYENLDFPVISLYRE